MTRANRAGVADDAELEEILGRLRAAGGRITSARRALVTALLGADGHPTAEGLAAAVQKRQPDVHQTTIYRILDDLEHLGVVEHTHLGHGPAVYHLSESAHPHVVCDRCGQVMEVDRKAFDALARQLRADHGFVIRPGHFAVTGRCRDCAEG
jgi:Fur family transcriptional regulator, ferric uptake regulator